jgi:hypothetical protein
VRPQRRGLAFDEIGTSQRRDTEVRLTHRWREMDSNLRPLLWGWAISAASMSFVGLDLKTVAHSREGRNGTTVAALRTLALGYQHLHAPRFVPPETFERARLTRAEQTLDRHVTSLYASYLQRDPWFQAANLRALSGRTCPRPDQAFLQRLIDYGIATGYLRGRTVQRTSG